MKQSDTNNTTVHEYFSATRADLMLEMLEHSDLCKYIHLTRSNTWAEQLACIASYLNVEVDAEFTQDELEDLYVGYLANLKEMRTGTTSIVSTEEEKPR